MTVGVRFNLREEAPSGYSAEDGLVIARYLESTGLVDYLHAVVGSPWGDPSYIQPQYYEPAQWADLAGQLRRAVRLPVVYTGRVNSIEVAERVLTAGHADVVGMARAYIAEPRILTKAQARPARSGPASAATTASAASSSPTDRTATMSDYRHVESCRLCYL